MMRPSVQRLPPELARAALEVARVLGDAGQRAWLVGGAVRDLALGVEPKDVDLACAARPEEIERLFPATYAVGKAFGTIVVRCGALDVQVTTFRTETGYADGRRPDSVSFGTSPEQDAARRDFTCNALYLDPLSDEFLDPTGGLADLAARRLRCVGEPERRFAEDGLRLLRLARLAAGYRLEIEPATEAGARQARAALRGVSAERVLGELLRLAEGPAPARGVGLLLELGLLDLLPGFVELARAGPGLAQRCAALERLGSRRASAFFALLFRPADGAGVRAAAEALLALRPARALLAAVTRAWALEPELEASLRELEHGGERRSRWIRLVRATEFEDALAVWQAWHPGAHERAREELVRRAAELEPERRHPVLFVTSAELARAAVPRGPRWAELLREGEDLQLDGELCTLEQARTWLAARARKPYEGGKTLRSP